MRKIRKIPLLLILLFFVFYSGSDKKIIEPANEIIGKWNWIKTVKLHPDNIIESPVSVGYSHQLEFINDKEVRFYYAGSLKEISDYVIEKGSVTMSLRKYYLKLKSDTLLLGKAYMNGTVMYYKKL